MQCHCRHQSSLADDGHVFVSRGTSLDNVQGATRILESALCCGVTVTGLRAHGVFFFTKTKALSMGSLSQPEIDRVTVHELLLDQSRHVAVELLP